MTVQNLLIQSNRDSAFMSRTPSLQGQSPDAQEKSHISRGAARRGMAILGFLTCAASVIFYADISPASAQGRSDGRSMTSSGAGNPFFRDVSRGREPAPSRLVANPSIVDFGRDVDPEAGSMVTIMLQSDGEQPVHLQSISILVPGAGKDSVRIAHSTCAEGDEIPGKGACALTLLWNARKPGLNGQIIIQHTGSNTVTIAQLRGSAAIQRQEDKGAEEGNSGLLPAPPDFVTAIPAGGSGGRKPGDMDDEKKHLQTRLIGTSGKTAIVEIEDEIIIASDGDDVHFDDRLFTMTVMDGRVVFRPRSAGNSIQVTFGRQRLSDYVDVGMSASSSRPGYTPTAGGVDEGRGTDGKDAASSGASASGASASGKSSKDGSSGEGRADGRPAGISPDRNAKGGTEGDLP